MKQRKFTQKNINAVPITCSSVEIASAQNSAHTRWIILTDHEVQERLSNTLDWTRIVVRSKWQNWALNEAEKSSIRCLCSIELYSCHTIGLSFPYICVTQKSLSNAIDKLCITEHIKKKKGHSGTVDGRVTVNWRILAFAIAGTVFMYAAMRSPATAKQVEKDRSFGRSNNTLDKWKESMPMSDRRYGAPLTASTNSTPFPIHPHPLYATTYTSIPTTWVIPFPQRTLASTTAGANATTLFIPLRAEESRPLFRSFSRLARDAVSLFFLPRTERALFPLLMLLPGLLPSTFNRNLDPNLEGALF